MSFLSKISTPVFSKISSQQIWAGVIFLMYAAIFFLQKPEYYLTDDLDFFLGVIFAPYIIRQISPNKNFRFFGISILLFLALLFFRSSSFYFFAFGFALLFLIESFFGKINHLAILLLIACSGLFRTVANIWTFPIRLQLTEWTGAALSMIGFPTEVSGNIIYLNGQSFAVAPACLGLDMLATAFVLALIVMAFFEKKYQWTTSFWWAAIWSGVALGLAIFSNFIRLTALVLFRVMPENFMHDVLGILSLVIYMLLPFFFGMRFFYKKMATPKISVSKNSNLPVRQAGNIFPKKIKIALHVILLFFLWQTGIQFADPLQLFDSSFEKIEVAGFEKNIDEKGVLKLENDSLLIYIKPPTAIFQGTHDPRFCWKGSGYEFSNIQEIFIENNKVFTAVLKKNEDQLFTAWWFDNGSEKTISEWTWRWRTIRGKEGFRLINVTAEDFDTLKNALPEFLATSFFEE